MRAFDAAREQPWAITEGGLATILRIAARRDLDPAAIAALRGDTLPQADRARRRGPVAVIDLEGPIFRKANLFTDISGATSLDIFARDLHAAMDDPAVGSVLLHIDSPGGEVGHINETAAMIRAATAVKPVTAYVSNLGASAAYWLASAASEIVCDAMAMLGSIGVIAAVPNPHAEDDTDITFVSSQSPSKRPDPTADDGRAEIQATLDTLAGIFIDRVAEYRGTTPLTVQETFGRGGLVVGQDAVRVGLADRLGSFEGLVAELALAHPAGTSGLNGGGPLAHDGTRRRQTARRARMDDEQETTMGEHPDIAALQAQLAEMRTQAEAAEVARLEAEYRNQALAESVAKLEGAARRKRFTDEVLGHANDGIRWLGATDDNVTYLEAIAEVFGEDSERFQGIVTHHRELAVQFRTVGVLAEVGTTQQGLGGPDDAFARLESEARALVERTPGLTLAQAKAQVVKEQPDIREALSRRGKK